MALSAEQLEMRKAGLGASDMAEVVCGSALRVYYQKIGERPLPQTERMKFGNDLEPIIALMYQQKYGVTLYRPNITFRSKTEPWMLATPDGLILKGGDLVSGIERGCEIKMVGPGMTHEWGHDGNDVPLRTQVQGLWSCDVVGVDRWEIGALLLFEDPYLLHGPDKDILIAPGIVRFHIIQLDLILMDKIREIGRKFWFEHVIPKIPPRPDGTRTTGEIIRLLHPESKRDSEQATHEEAEIIFREKIAQAKARRALAVWEAAKQATELAIGDRAGLWCIGGDRVTFKTNKKGVRVHHFKADVPVALDDRVDEPIKPWWEEPTEPMTEGEK